MTGWALLEYPLRLCGWGQVRVEEFSAEALLLGLGPRDEAVVENFRLRPSKAKSLGWSDLKTSQIIGQIRAVAEAHGLPVLTQEPGDKAAVPDELLRAVGAFPSGRHARDACRHAVLRLLRVHKAAEDPVVAELLRRYVG